MDKILMMIGTVFFIAVVKVRAAMETMIESLRGETGFMMMSGICVAGLIAALVVLSWTSRKRRCAAAPLTGDMGK